MIIGHYNVNIICYNSQQRFMTMFDQTIKDKVTTGDLSKLDPSLKKKLDEILMNRTLVNVESVSMEEVSQQKVDVETVKDASWRVSGNAGLGSSTSSVALSGRRKRESTLDQSVFEEDASGFFAAEEDKVNSFGYYSLWF